MKRVARRYCRLPLGRAALEKEEEAVAVSLHRIKFLPVFLSVGRSVACRELPLKRHRMSTKLLRCRQPGRSTGRQSGREGGRQAARQASPASSHRWRESESVRGRSSGSILSVGLPVCPCAVATGNRELSPTTTTTNATAAAAANINNSGYSRQDRDRQSSSNSTNNKGVMSRLA